MKFSPSRKCFYPEDLIEEYIIAGSLPEDLIDVTSHEVDMYFFTQEPEGKMLGSKNGRPSWVDLPEKTSEQIIAGVTSSINELLAIATVKIAPLQDAVDFGMATDAEIASLTKWKTYRVLVNRVTSQSGFPTNIDWPPVPE